MEYGFLKEQDREFPPIVHVETTNICNLRCIHCPHNNIYRTVPDYKPQSISMELWRKIVDEVCEYPSALRLTPDGEPLLPNEFVEQVEYVYKKGVHLFTLNTNGTFLSGEKTDILLKPSNTKVAIEVSLDGLFKETYDQIRVGSNYELVMANVFSFVAKRNKKKLDNVKIMVSIVDQPEVTKGELELFDRFWTQVVDRVIMRNYVDTKELTPKKMVGKRIVNERWPCLVVFTRLVVTYDGRVRFCPDDWQKSTVLGNAYESSLRDIWHSKPYLALRESHQERTFKHPTCQQCTDWKVIRWGLDYTKALEKVFSQTGKREESLKYLYDRNQYSGNITE